jgi:tetratricopeptide (TPR) repeat protein
MNIATGGRWLRLVLIAAAATLAFGPALRAQIPDTPTPTSGGGVTNQTTMGVAGGLGDSLSYGIVGDQHQRDQFAAFQSFSKETDPAKRIQKGREFLRRYPKSSFEEQVDASLADTYRTQADWKDEYAYAHLALTLNPNDVDVLATVAWTIPHVFDPNASDANDQLDKAERYSKHALEALANLPKPAGMTDAQFSAAKARRAFQSHSALGLVYLRRNDYDNSERELALATKDNPTPDQTDLYVLGMDRVHLSRFAEAVDAFHACAAIAGTFQAPCNKNAAVASNQAAAAQSATPKSQ